MSERSAAISSGNFLAAWTRLRSLCTVQGWIGKSDDIAISAFFGPRALSTMARSVAENGYVCRRHIALLGHGHIEVSTNELGS
jgi:hypothetical protein